VAVVNGGGARRTQAERRATSEAALLSAAAELIAERGIERTSLRSIGDRAGVSRAMPAYHFGSKDALIDRLAQRGHERTMAAAFDALDGGPRGTGTLSKFEELRVTIETFLEVFARAEAPEERAVVVMWGATFPSEARLDAMVESDRETHGLLAGHIRAGQVEGSIRSDLDADSAAVMVMGMARGVAAFSLTHIDIADTEQVRTACGDAIVGALAPRPQPARPGRRPAPPSTATRGNRA
jgi:AcrR family transcriptional regulator